MSSYLFKLLCLLVFSVLIAVCYYALGFHQVTSSGYTLYFSLAALVYASYKGLQIYNSGHKISFSPVSLLWYFLIHLFIVCWIFFVIAGSTFGVAIVLFLKILYFSLLPIFLIFISLGFGRTLYLKLFPHEKQHSKVIQFLISLLLGFVSFISLLSIAGFVWWYWLTALAIICLTFIAVSYTQIWYFLKWLWSYKISFENSYNSPNQLERYNIKLLTAEFFFIMITLLLAINLVSIMRPFPIGWDDLGAYMNFPRLMAAWWEVGFLGSMMSWSVFTGIWYMFENPVQAFFLNNVWGFLSVIVLCLITSDIFSSSHKKTFIHIPTLIALLFISLPMIIFQQAKDMKLDPGLFFMSISALYLMYHTLLWDYKKKQKYILYFIIGISLGFLFTVKFTALLTVIAIIGLMFYKYLWWSGLAGYFALFVWIFTRLWLWNYMNVSYPSENEIFKNTVFMASLFIAAWAFGYSFMQSHKHFKQSLLYVVVICLWVLVWVLPWSLNNIVRSWNIGVWEILLWKSETFQVDYWSIHSPEKLNEIIANAVVWRGLSSSWTTSNEDFGRYFGYEKWINNYIKLPWNLTMQINQKWEFTNIGWLFLALIPGLFLFLPTRKRNFIPVVVWLSYLSVLTLFLYPATDHVLANFLSTISLPWWYLVLLFLFILPLLAIVSSLNTEKKYIKLFTYNAVFSAVYIFLWTISAFGIVWYGIVMYFNMLLMIAICLYYLSSYDTAHMKKSYLHLLGSATIVVLLCIWIFNTVLPYSFNNIKSASYTQFKTWEITTSNAPFLYHRDYAPILFALNVGQENFTDFTSKTVAPLFLEKTPDIWKYNIRKSIDILNQINTTKNIDASIKAQAEISLNNIYAEILSPSKSLQNDRNIYRVGTFMKYFITQNNSRLLEDSLLDQFQTYFYDEDVGVTVENFQKADIDYLLVDLNAATIDQDPAKKLTQRMENMFTTFTSDRLELIETDSICLRVALDVYGANKDITQYDAIAAVNHSSPAYSRATKLGNCYSAIYALIVQDQISDERFSYLIPLSNHVVQENMTDELKIKQYLAQSISQGYKVLFKIK